MSSQNQETDQVILADLASNSNTADNTNIDSVKEQIDESNNTNNAYQEISNLKDDSNKSSGSKKSRPVRKKKDPSYIPRKGYFFEHDFRDEEVNDVKNQNEEPLCPIVNELSEKIEPLSLSDSKQIEQTEKVENLKTSELKSNPNNNRKKDNRRNRREFDENNDSPWTHDRFNINEQQPKSKQEILKTYGYDIREGKKIVTELNSGSKKTNKVNKASNKKEPTSVINNSPKIDENLNTKSSQFARNNNRKDEPFDDEYEDLDEEGEEPKNVKNLRRPLPKKQIVRQPVKNNYRDTDYPKQDSDKNQQTNRKVYSKQTQQPQQSNNFNQRNNNNNRNYKTYQKNSNENISNTQSQPQNSEMPKRYSSIRNQQHNNGQSESFNRNQNTNNSQHQTHYMYNNNQNWHRNVNQKFYKNQHNLNNNNNNYQHQMQQVIEQQALHHPPPPPHQQFYYIQPPPPPNDYAVAMAAHEYAAVMAGVMPPQIYYPGSANSTPPPHQTGVTYSMENNNAQISPLAHQVNFNNNGNNHHPHHHQQQQLARQSKAIPIVNPHRYE